MAVADVGGRTLAAVLGGYGCAYAATAALAAALPLAPADAAGFAPLAGFLVYVAAILWAFAARHARGAWLGLIGTTACCALAAWALLSWR